jgi:hypothetical protein
MLTRSGAVVVMSGAETITACPPHGDRLQMPAAHFNLVRE